MMGFTSLVLPHLFIFLILGGWPHCNAIAEQACGKALGMESGVISEAQISASSEVDNNHAAHHGRLKFQGSGIKRGAWSAHAAESSPWLQIDLMNNTATVTRAATQGRHGNELQWITTYKLQYSNNTANFQYYREQGQNHDKVFDGNTDQDTIVYHELNPPINARYIRFRPITWKGFVSMRVELYGCLESSEQEVVESSCDAAEGCRGVCRSLKFATPSLGYALVGHVIKNISLSVGMGHTCKERCAMERTCVSFNIGPPVNNRVLCQLSDSDRSLHPGDLKGQRNFTYRDTENPCSSNPCLHNGNCLNGYTDKKYLCICQTGTWGERCEKVSRSCKELYDKNITYGNRAYLLNLDSVKLPLYCHMTSDLGACGGGGWTLVMKTDGKKSTFHYDSTYWTNKTGYNLTAGQSGFDDQETKLPSYWNTSFTKICMGMKIGSQLIFIVLKQNRIVPSLYSLIADGQKRSTTLGRNTWKSLVGVKATLQTYCDYEGFNQVCSHSIGSRARIGIVNNDNNLCNTCDSRIGFGTGGYIDDTNTCGNVGPGSSDNEGKITNKAMGYILVQ